MQVGIIQQTCAADKAQNLAHTSTLIRKSVEAGAELVVLQELHASLYFCQEEKTDYFDLAEPIPGPSSLHFSALAKELGIVLVCSFFEKRAPGLYHNTAVVFDTDGSIAGKYRKMHIPDDPGFYEKFYFTPGDLDFTPIKTSLGTLGVLICWDQWYPEAARLMAMAGAELLIYPTAIGWDKNDDAEEQKRQRDAWQIAQRAHAVSNGLPVIAVNRTGFEADPSQHTQGIDFWGSSFIAGPQGEIIYESPIDKEDVAVVKIDTSRTEEVRRIWPYFRDRRIDAYADITERYLK